MQEWFVPEKVFDTFPQAFATTYDNQFCDKYYQEIGLTKLLEKHMLIWEGNNVQLGNIYEKFSDQVEEIYNKTVSDTAWAEDNNEVNKKYLKEFDEYIKNLDVENCSPATEIPTFFEKQQIAHVSAWVMAILDWDRALFSNHLKKGLLDLGVEEGEVEETFASLVTNYDPENQETVSLEDMIKDKQPDLNRLLELARDVIKTKRERKEIFDNAFKKLYALWKAFSTEVGIEVGLVKFMYPWEADDLVSGKLTADTLKHRSENHVFFSDQNGRQILIGQQAKDFLGKLSFVKNDVDLEVTEFKGAVAFQGKAQGRVSIVNSAEDLEKVSEGDIIVSHMTEPALMPALKKCAAIVTEIGGITCHAAIIAREMKKPCIIGTKIATQVLKDGDEVEVDAESGVVRILKRAKL